MRALFFIGTFFAAFTIVSCHNGGGEKIYIYNNTLSKIPDSVFEKENLTLLDIGLEGYTIYPPLSVLDSQRIMLPLKELPEKIGELSNLTTLRVNGSKIDKLPSSITKLNKLEKLDLSMSPNLVIINELEKLTQLHSLRILNVYGVNASEHDILVLKNSLGSKVKIIFTTSEFLSEGRK